MVRQELSRGRRANVGFSQYKPMIAQPQRRSDSRNQSIRSAWRVKVRFPPFEDRSSCSAGRERGLRPLEANHSLPRAMTLRVFVSGVETISPGSHRDASLRSDLALVAGEKGDQSSAGNHLLALEVDEAPFDRVEVNVASTDASKGVGVDISCCDGHLTISPSLISALDHSDSLRRHNGLHRSSHRFQATSCPGAHHRKPPPLRHAQAHTGRAQRPFAGSAASCHEPHIPFIR